MSTNDLQKLRSCPFCGGEAHTYHNNLWHVACNDCRCKLAGFVTEAEAIEAWNQRADEFSADDDYERRMDELLCRLTNGKWSKSRSYSVDFMVSCVDEAYDEILDPPVESHYAPRNTRADEPAECDNIGGKCSRCGKDLPEPGYTGYEYEGNYCPTCGAKVRKPEQPERPVDNAQADSRERLEAEVTATVSNLVKYCGAHPALFEKAKSWLDRQAAITERELCAKCEWPNLAAMPDLEQQERIAEQDRRIVEYAEQVDSLTAERDELRRQLNITRDIAREFRDERNQLHEAIDAMENGQFYAMYKAKCEECEEAVSFAKRLENAVNDGQPVTLFGVDYFTAKQNKKLLAEHKQLTKKLKRLRRRLAKAKKERDHLKTVVKTQADSFKKLEAELTQARSNQAGKDG